MLRSFTRNFSDESSEAGFQFTFFCDICNDGYKSSFVQSDSYKKGGLLRGVGQGVGLVGGLIGGRTSTLGYGAERGADLLSNRYENRSPAWLKEHEAAFERAQNEARQHFHRCPQCNAHVCDQCWNEDEGLCTQCAPRQQVYVARMRAEAMKRNIDQAAENATVWKGTIESKTTICPACGKPAGTGNFCNNCGASMALQTCSRCGAQNALAVRFCNNCGNNLSQPAAPPPPPAG
ncbi:MAG: zinc ribbon domain-containing protein, partial [Coriobacteriia bacterium]|nr:zinc ribbon domain-containing protein [Coriobacteriia bacterium]